MKKVCTICQEEKVLEDFTFDKGNTKDGRRASCKECCRKKNAEYIKANPDKKLESDKKSYEKLKEKKLAQKKEYYLIKREEILLKRKEYAANNKEKISIKNKEYRETHLEDLRYKNKMYHRENAKKLTEKRQERIDSTPLRQFKERIRLLTKNAFYRLKHNKAKRTHAILGADWEIIKEHIVSQFNDGMTWEHFIAGDIHIDHIQPLASAKSEEELVALCHYKNLQPLWALDNLKKGATFDGVNYKNQTTI
jgi:hypothetical protein